jgi:hypothetical protein
MRTIFVLAVLLLSVSFANAQTFVVCSGQFRANCQAAHDVFLPCGGDVHAWAKDSCKLVGSSDEPKYLMARTHQKSGNACGYEIWRITCR